MPRIYPEGIQKKREKNWGQAGAKIGVEFGSKIDEKRVQKIGR